MINRTIVRKSVLIWISCLLILALFPPLAVAEGIRVEDAVLEAEIRSVLAKPAGELTEADMAQITSLTLQNRGAKSLRGLEYAVNLQTLTLEGNPQLSDLAPLEGMTHLRKLVLDNNGITSLAPLEHLPELEYLSAANNRIVQLYPVALIPELTTLIMNHNAVKDIEPLQNLKKLKSVDLSANDIDYAAPCNKASLKMLKESGVQFVGEPAKQSGGTAESVEQSAPKEISKSYVFPLLYSRATQDAIRHFVSDGKGTFVTISWNYMNVTHNYGKTWESRRLPRNANYQLNFCKDTYYLSISDYKGTENYASKDGKTWTSFYLYSPGGKKLAIDWIGLVNGKRVLTALDEYVDNTSVFTSADGLAWNYQSDIPTRSTQIIWSGKGYTALAGGRNFLYRGNPLRKNQFYVDPRNQIAAELIVFTSPDLMKWTKRSGDSTDVQYTFGESKNFAVLLRQPAVNGKIVLYDYFNNVYTSLDGSYFTTAKEAKALQSKDWRSPVYGKDNQYYVFMREWISSTQIDLLLLTSKDKVSWKKTRLKGMNQMFAQQVGNQFVGWAIDSGMLMLSDDGLHWRKIK